MFLFYGKDDLFSNWNWRGIVVKGIFFKTVEHFMMYCKAMLFGDLATAAEILVASTPREAKALGRKVKGFVEEIWVQKRKGYVFRGCLAKAEQYPEVDELLRWTEERIIVEASPSDTIWGVGLGKDDPRIYDSDQWRGLDLLGYVWMDVRALRKNKECNK